MANVEKAKRHLSEAEELLAQRFNLYRFEGPVMDALQSVREALDEDPIEAIGAAEQRVIPPAPPKAPRTTK